MRVTSRESALCPFQSTLPARGATAQQAMQKTGEEISIHAPRTGSDMARRAKRPGARNISIHAPRTGSDADAAQWRAARNISIHAPRTGSDGVNAAHVGIYLDFNPRSPHGERRQLQTPITTISYFNPRSPHGERHSIYDKPYFVYQFQSTLPARGATKGTIQNRLNSIISIHAPRTGSDSVNSAEKNIGVKDFNPRSPHGERHV